MLVLVGWAAATNSVAPPAYLLFAIVFLWTPPHSWALADLVKADYERATSDSDEVFQPFRLKQHKHSMKLES